MKKNAGILLLLVMIIHLNACRKDDQSEVRHVANDFLSSIDQGDYESVKKNCSKALSQKFDLFNQELSTQILNTGSMFLSDEQKKSIQKAMELLKDKLIHSPKIQSITKKGDGYVVETSMEVIEDLNSFINETLSKEIVEEKINKIKSVFQTQGQAQAIQTLILEMTQIFENKVNNLENFCKYKKTSVQYQLEKVEGKWLVTDILE